MGNTIFISVQGPDRPGITFRLMEKIAKSGYKLLDIGQSVTKGLLSLALVIQGQEEQNLLKELLFEAKKMDMSLDFKFIDEQILPSTSNRYEKFVLSCVSSNANLSASFLSDISKVLASKHINILRLETTGLEFQSLEIKIQWTELTPEINENEFIQELMILAQKHQNDLAFLRDNIFRYNKRLIVFDMDSTLIEEEVIDEMAKAHGVEAKVKAITKKAMNGEYDFATSLRERVRMLEGMEVSKMQNILNNIHFTPGTEKFIQITKKQGMKLAVISGGFTFFAQAIKEKLGLHYAFANELEIMNGHLTGHIKGPAIIDARQKAFLLEFLAQQLNISLDQVVAIGDGANDLEMLSIAGMGIAFHAKDVVKQQTKQQIGLGPMTTALSFLGLNRS